MIDKKKISARGLLLTGVAAVVFVAFMGSAFLFSSSDATGGWVFIKQQPVVTVSPSPTPYKRKTNVTIAGSGFEPNQEIGIRIMMGGVLSDISFLIKPRPVPNEFGAFASTWKLNREIRRKLLKAATAYTLSVVDAEGNTIAHAPMVMDKAKKKKKKK